MEHVVSPAVTRPSRAGLVAEWLSIGCAIHCLAMPFLIAALPLIGMGFLLDERVETAVIGASAALATFSIGNGYRTHRRGAVLVLLAVAVVLLALGRIVPDGTPETAFTVTGAFTMAATQFWNRRLGKPCGCAIHPGHAHG